MLNTNTNNNSMDYYVCGKNEDHPKYRLLKYNKSTKLSKQEKKIIIDYRNKYGTPPIVYCEISDMNKQLTDITINNDNIIEKEIILENDLFAIGQQKSYLPIAINNNNNENEKHVKGVDIVIVTSKDGRLKYRTKFWRPNEYYLADRIYRNLKKDFYNFKIDTNELFLLLFPVFIDMSGSGGEDQQRKPKCGNNHRSKKLLSTYEDENHAILPSTTPLTRHDLFQLEEKFHFLLKNEQALEIGLCSKRRRIYEDLFDELIRITTLECTERGLLLARIKNEYKQLMNEYETVYKSGMAYAMRCYLHKMQTKQDLEQKIDKLENDIKQLKYENDFEIEREPTPYEETYESRTLRENLIIMRTTNANLRRDLEATLTTLVSTSINGDDTTTGVTETVLPQHTSETKDEKVPVPNLNK
ncbi:unnamed protein product [Didymodactylos carnosus]|uniref:Uncharacterized protein n=1 Tax=Didymodactylos carnosus TaxID=1234261 RepID=A0A815I0G4_9BILA|nr:unnamed protein product [Didymodactylos carnosus]CAF4232576.1 unnamed protein product [Didymodactylos carnosus]